MATKETKTTETEKEQAKVLKVPESTALVEPPASTFTPKDFVVPAPGTWQAALWNIANELDAGGNHWLGNIFRAQSQVE